MTSEDAVQIYVARDGTSVIALHDRGQWVQWQEYLCDPDSAIASMFPDDYTDEA